LIAGTATPIAVIALERSRGHLFLILIWMAAGVGILKTLVWIQAPKWLTAVVAVGAGLLTLPFFPALGSTIGSHNSMLLLAGGILYLAGAVAYALKRPDPLPEVFGYHEIFHVLVIAAAVLHFSAVYDALRLHELI
ncbi:MAG: PAQR family membrane homeostasis protein TrhA, partial [Bdellovibrionota bacterium]